MVLHDAFVKKRTVRPRGATVARQVIFCESYFSILLTSETIPEFVLVSE
jgi:hypothetical protein